MAELCPQDSRRATAEMWSKLILAHCTTAFALCHLLSIRGERILSLRLVFFLIYPMLICAQTVMALIGLAFLTIQVMIAYGINLCKGRARLDPSLKRAAAILFGSIEYTKDDTRPAVWRFEAQRKRFEAQRRKWSWTPTPSASRAKTAGRIVLALFLCVQCAGSIILYERRARRDAATESDGRVMDLAFGGLTIGVLTILSLLWQPHLFLEWHNDTNLRQYDPPKTPKFRSSPHTVLSNIECILEIFRDCPDETDLSRRLFMSFLFNSIIVSNMPQAGRKSQQSVLFLSLWSGWPSWYYWKTCGSAAMVIFFILQFRPEINNPLLRQLDQKVRLVLSMFVYGLVFYVMAFIVVSPLLDFIATWEIIDNEMRVLAAWPTDQACPWLWQDPMAGWLWSLA